MNSFKDDSFLDSFISLNYRFPKQNRFNNNRGNVNEAEDLLPKKPHKGLQRKPPSGKGKEKEFKREKGILQVERPEGKRK